MGRVFLTPLDPVLAAGPLPDEPEHVALAWAGVDPPPPARGRPPRRRVRRGRRGDGRCSTRSGSPTRRSNRRRSPGTARDAPRSWSSPAPRRAPSARSRPRCSTRSGSTRPSSPPSSCSTTARRAPPRPHLPRAVSLPGVDHRPRVRRWPTPSPPPTSSGRCAPRPATVLEDVRTFDVFRSDALGDGRRSLAFSAALPRSGPHPHRRRRRRAPAGRDRRGAGERTAPRSAVDLGTGCPRQVVSSFAPGVRNVASAAERAVNLTAESGTR